jgi:pre-rRNA-processing protein TSR4
MATWSDVLLGVCDAPCNGLYLSPYDNKIGGYPDFYPSSTLTSLPHCTICGGYQQLLTQVYCPLEGSVNHRLLHLYCCTVPTCHRRSEGWLALRSEQRDSTLSSTNYTVTSSSPATATAATSVSAVSDKLQTSTDPNEWCVDAEDWGELGETETLPEERDENRGKSNKERCQEFDEGCDGARIKTNARNNTNKSSTEVACDYETNDIESSIVDVTQNLDSLQLTGTWKKIESEHAMSPFTGPHFKSFYLNVVSEPSLDEHRESQHAEELLKKYRQENGWGGQGSEEGFARKKEQSSPNSPVGRGGCQKGGGVEKYEKAVAKHGDMTFQKFKKTLSLCPNQLLRYRWNGEPLLITDKQRIPQRGEVTCKSCDAPAVFELQLMPPLVYVLQNNARLDKAVADEDGILEFGTVLVFSCSKSCWDDRDGGFREETVFVEADPDSEQLNALTAM